MKLTGRLGLLLILLMSSALVFGQPTIELLGAPGAGGPAGSGPSDANQTVTLYSNSTTPFSPLVTATFSLSNQQFTSIEGLGSMGGMQFGATNDVNSNSSPRPFNYYTSMYTIGQPSNANFTACNTCTGGIDANQNYGMNLYLISDALISPAEVNLYPLTSTVYYGDLTITFNKPVDNPVVHFSGMGGVFQEYGQDNQVYTIGFSQEYELITPDVTLVQKSGSTYFKVASNRVFNDAVNQGQNFAGLTNGQLFNGYFGYAASGTVAAIGNNITSLTFKVSLTGDGGEEHLTNGTPSDGPLSILWARTISVAGELSNIGVSMEADAILPVELTYFDATTDCESSKLSWGTATETNNSHFVIERSADGDIFTAVDQVQGAGTTNTAQEYRYTDSPGNGVWYYRLKQVDYDGTTSYSEIEVVQIDCGALATGLFPNPVINEANLEFTAKENGQALFYIYNQIGKLLMRFDMEVKAGEHYAQIIDVTNLPSSGYFIQIVNGSSFETIKFIKQ